MRAATIGPMSGTWRSVSSSAAIIGSSAPKCRASVARCVSPTSRMPSAIQHAFERRRAAGVDRGDQVLGPLASRPCRPSRLRHGAVASSSARCFIATKSSTVSAIEVGDGAHVSNSTSAAMKRSPRPSMSIARREAKWNSACTRCAGQNRPPVQRATTSPSSRSTAEPQTGHSVGNWYGGCIGLPRSHRAGARPRSRARLPGSRRRRGER